MIPLKVNTSTTNDLNHNEEERSWNNKLRKQWQ
jgi:hypothetical protein